MYLHSSFPIIMALDLGERTAVSIISREKINN